MLVPFVSLRSEFRFFFSRSSMLTYRGGTPEYYENVVPSMEIDTNCSHRKELRMRLLNRRYHFEYIQFGIDRRWGGFDDFEHTRRVHCYAIVVSY